MDVHKKLRIGFVLDDTLDSSDGVQQYVLTLGKWLSSQGHYVRYLAGETKRNDIVGIFSLGKNVHVRFNQNVLSIPLPVSRKKIGRILDSEQFDVLHVQMPYSPLLARRVIAAAPTSTAVVGTFHILPASRIVSLATKLLGIILHRSLRRFDAMCAVSEPAQQYMKSVFRVAGSVIPNGVDIHSFKQISSKRKTGRLKIVFLGRLVERKGAEYLLRAFAVSSNQKNAVLTIAGTGPLASRLKNLAEELGIAKSVDFPGFIAESDKAALLGSADIAVFPSTGGESFGIILVEAVAAGSGVVLAGDNAGYQTVIEDAQQRVKPQDIIGFAAKLDNLISDENLRSKIGREQQALLHRFAIETVGQQIVKLYDDALRNRPQRG